MRGYRAHALLIGRKFRKERAGAVYLAIFERARLKPGMAYLDAGCGAGMAAQIAAERGAEVFGLDAAPNLVEIARARVPGGEFHLGDLESLPFRTRSLIWSPDLIHFNMPGILGRTR